MNYQGLRPSLSKRDAKRIDGQKSPTTSMALFGYIDRKYAVQCVTGAAFDDHFLMQLEPDRMAQKIVAGSKFAISGL